MSCHIMPSAYRFAVYVYNLCIYIHTNQYLGTHLTLSNDDTTQHRRIPIDHSIVGFVARTGESMNVRDAYAEPR